MSERALPPGWSNAARRRAGRPTRRVSTPIGDGIRKQGDGYTMYEDFGTDSDGDNYNTQIWDQS